MNGIIFFEDGTVAQFGKIRTVLQIAETAQSLLPKLIQQERDQLFDTITDKELQNIISKRATQDVDDE